RDGSRETRGERREKREERRWPRPPVSRLASHVSHFTSHVSRLTSLVQGSHCSNHTSWVGVAVRTDTRLPSFENEIASMKLMGIVASRSNRPVVTSRW